MVFLPYLSGIQIAFLDIKGGIQNVSLSLLLSVTASGMSHTCLYTPAATGHHRTLAGTQRPAEDRRLSWPSWLGYIPR